MDEPSRTDGAVGDGASAPERQASAPERRADPPREPGPAAHGRRYRRRELAFPGGGRLVLFADGTLTRYDADGVQEHAWAPDDPEWPRLAIRFGLRVQSATVTPPGRFVEGTKPPRPGG